MRREFTSLWHTAVRNVAVFILLGLVPLSAQQAVSPAPPAQPAADLKRFVQQFDGDIAAKLADAKVVGASVALIHGGKIVWSKSYGFADRDRGIAATRQTVFQVGSVSKSVAAWGLMRLVQEGKIDLDAPAERYLTRWHLPPSALDNQKVTIRRLLSQTAGLTLEGYLGADPDQPLPTVEQSLSGNNGDTGGGLRGVNKGSVVVVVEPGTKRAYSGGGYTLLQLIVDEKSGEPFADYMQSVVLRPLGMQHSAYTWLPKLRPITAKAYDKKGVLLPNYLFTEQAAAGLYTTAPELAKFVIASMTGPGGTGATYHPGGGVLSAQTVTLMETPAPNTAEAWSGGWGLGPAVEDLPNGIRMVGHDGSNRGWKAEWVALPQRGEGFVILTNGDSARGILRPLKCDWVVWEAGSAPTYCSTAVRPTTTND